MVEQNGELFAVEKDQASLVGTVGWMMYMYMMCCFKLVLEFGHQICEKNLALYFCNPWCQVLLKDQRRKEALMCYSSGTLSDIEICNWHVLVGPSPVCPEVWWSNWWLQRCKKWRLIQRRCSVVKGLFPEDFNSFTGKRWEHKLLVVCRNLPLFFPTNAITWKKWNVNKTNLAGVGLYLVCRTLCHQGLWTHGLFGDIFQLSLVGGCLCEATPGEVKKVFEKVAQSILRMATKRFHMPFFSWCFWFFLIPSYTDSIDWDVRLLSQALNHEVVGEEQTESAKRALSCKYASCSNLRDAFKLDFVIFRQLVGFRFWKDT